MSAHDIHALSGAYAVDALDEHERAQFERHLEGCASCREEVVGLRGAAGHLAATTDTPPPASLRDSVLEGISQVRPLPPLTDDDAETSEPAGGATPQPIPIPGVASGRPAHARRRRWVPALAAAAAVLAAIGAGAVITQPWQDEDRTEQVPTVAEQVLQAEDARQATIRFDDGSSATVTHSRSEGRAVIQTEDMAPPPEGKVYELWLQGPEGDMAPAGLMPEDPDQTMVLDGNATEARAVGITVEPEGGSEEPTSEPIALFDLSEQA